MCYIISMYAAFPLLPLAKLMFYKEFLSPILFGGQISGAKIRFSGAIIGISGAKMRGKITVPQNFRGKNIGFQGQKWDVESRVFLFRGKNSGAIFIV